MTDLADVFCCVRDCQDKVSMKDILRKSIGKVGNPDGKNKIGGICTAKNKLNNDIFFVNYEVAMWVTKK